MKVLRPKPIYAILFMMIRKEFNQEFDDCKLCTEDEKVPYRFNDEMKQELYESWLLEKGYMEYKDSED